MLILLNVMNHKWVKIDKNHSECKVCGCEQEIFWFGKYPTILYSRSDMPFGETRPDCIEWDSENNIDNENTDFNSIPFLLG